MSGFRFCAAATLLALAAPAVAQMSKPLGSQWIDAVKDEDGAKINKLAADRSSLNSAVLDYQRDGEGAIHIAVRAGNIDYLRVMLQLGANPNLVGDKLGETPLTTAVIVNQPDAVLLLIGFRARVDQTNRAGETPLIKAVRLHRADMVAEFLNDGADPDRADYTGKSARAYAVGDARFPQIAKLLSEAPKRGARSVAGPKLN